MGYQIKMDQAFENYLSLSNELLSDGEYILNIESDDISWKRNFIRTVVSIIEGYSHCFRQITVIGVEIGAGNLTKKEIDVLYNEEKYSLCERIKLTLKGIYKIVGIKPLPNFGTEEWRRAMKALEKRNSLTHPKSIVDLEISENTWDPIRTGLTWLFEQHSTLMKSIYERHKEKIS